MTERSVRMRADRWGTKSITRLNTAVRWRQIINGETSGSFSQNLWDVTSWMGYTARQDQYSLDIQLLPSFSIIPELDWPNIRESGRFLLVWSFDMGSFFGLPPGKWRNQCWQLSGNRICAESLTDIILQIAFCRRYVMVPFDSARLGAYDVLRKYWGAGKPQFYDISTATISPLFLLQHIGELTLFDSVSKDNQHRNGTLNDKARQIIVELDVVSRQATCEISR